MDDFKNKDNITNQGRGQRIEKADVELLQDSDVKSVSLGYKDPWGELDKGNYKNTDDYVELHIFDELNVKIGKIMTGGVYQNTDEDTPIDDEGGG
jgi:hypothetical protein